MDNGGFGTGVLGHPPAGKARRRVLKCPVPERPIVHVCKRKMAYLQNEISIRQRQYIFKMRGHRGYNICPWLKNGKRETCGKSCREEYCKAHRAKIRNGSRDLVLVVVLA